jgi:pilus assembly protein Flp/PilA
MGLVWRFAGDDSGATAIEYGLIAGLLAAACITAFAAFGSSLTGLFEFVRDAASGAITTALEGAG